MKSTGERIKQRRKELSLSVDDLAAELGKSRATIYRYESDEIENFPVTVLEPLAAALCTTPAYLMGWEDDPTDYEEAQLIAELPKNLFEHFNGDTKAVVGFKKTEYEDVMRECEVDQKDFLKKYYELDAYGKIVVDFVLNAEHQRTLEQISIQSASESEDDFL